MISATSTRLKSLSAMLCSPRITLMLDAADPAVQWAAVRTWVDEMRVPPHQGERPFLLTSPTCQGYSCSSVSCPPTIRPLAAPPLTPHWQVPGAAPPLTPGAAVVAGAGVVVATGS